MRGCKTDADRIHAGHGFISTSDVENGFKSERHITELRTISAFAAIAKAAINSTGLEFFEYGEMAEWSMAVVLKTTEPERVPGVRIPLSPPTFARLLATGSRASVGKPMGRLKAP